MDDVRCINCGFLALRWRFSQELVEAPRPYRDTGRPPVELDRQSDLGGESYLRVPVCFEDQRDFWQEAAYVVVPPNDPERIDDLALRDMLLKQINCDRFARYRQGSTPKEHREMLDRQWMIEREDAMRQIVWRREDERDVAMKKREDARDALVNAREKARDEREDARDRDVNKRHRTELWVLGWVIAGATLVSALVGAGATLGAAEWLGHENTVVVAGTPTPAPASTATLGP
jgi:hypothetical protein